MSDWSDNTYEPGDTSTDQSNTGPDSSWTPDPTDTLYSYEPAAREIMSMTDAVAGFVGANVGGGKYDVFQQPAPTPTGEEAKAAANAQSKSIFAMFATADPRVQAAALTVGMGALSGMGAGYFTGKKQDEANKIAQQQVDVNRQLAQSQEALNKSKTSQDLSGFRFNQPRGLIESAAKPFQPAPQLDVTKRWRMPA